MAVSLLIYAYSTRLLMRYRWQQHSGLREELGAEEYDRHFSPLRARLRRVTGVARLRLRSGYGSRLASFFHHGRRSARVHYARCDRKFCFPPLFWRSL